MFKKSLISVKIDLLKFFKKKKNKENLEGTCYCKVAFPVNMPKEVRQEITEQLNNVIDTIRIYL